MKAKITIAACLLLVAGQASLDLYLPSIPAMAQELGAAPYRVQLSIPFYLLAYAVVQPLVGPLADRFGRRPILVITSLLSVLGSIGCALAGSVGSLLAFRLVQGIGAGSGSTLSRALLRDTFSGASLARRMSYLSIAWGGTPLIAPVVGGYLEELFGWRSSFWSLALLGFASLLYFIFFVPETQDRQSRAPLHPVAVWKKYRLICTHREFIGFALAFFFTYGLVATYATASPLVLEEGFGLTPVSYGWSMLLVGLGFIISSLVNSRLVDHFSISRIVRVAALIAASGALLLLLTGLADRKEVWLFVALVLIIEMGVGAIFPNAMAGAMHPFPDHTASASALVGTLAALGGALFSLVIAELPSNSQVPLALLMLIQLTMIYLLIMRVAMPAKRRMN